VRVDFGPAVGELRTYESQFLLLGALDPQEQVQLLSVDGDVPPGTPVS
jgi:hypothetical protein